jgi:putative ABC transport system substrate-binding protein
MRRREFISLIGAAVASPLAARAQSASMPVVGFLSSRGPEDSRDLVTAFREGIRTSGYIERENVVVEYRWARGQYDRLPILAADLVSGRLAALVAFGEPSVLAAKAVTSSVPIIFTTGGDPVKAGLVESLNHPGGNMTGLAS